MKLSLLSNETNSLDPVAIHSRVFVGNLNTFQCSKSDVEVIFQRYGRIIGISMHKGYAFVQFTNPLDANSACDGEDGRFVLGQNIDVNLVSQPKVTHQPSSNALAVHHQHNGSFSSSSTAAAAAAAAATTALTTPPQSTPPTCYYGGAVPSTGPRKSAKMSGNNARKRHKRLRHQHFNKFKSNFWYTLTDHNNLIMNMPQQLVSPASSAAAAPLSDLSASPLPATQCWYSTVAAAPSSTSSSPSGCLNHIISNNNTNNNMNNLINPTTSAHDNPQEVESTSYDDDSHYYHFHQHHHLQHRHQHNDDYSQEQFLNSDEYVNDDDDDNAADIPLHDSNHNPISIKELLRGVLDRNDETTTLQGEIRALTQSPPPAPPDVLICGNCRQLFHDVEQLLHHRRQYCRLRLECKCQSSSQSDAAAAAAADAVRLICTRCKDTFADPWPLIEHVQNVHGTQIYCVVGGTSGGSVFDDDARFVEQQVEPSIALRD